MNIFGNPWEKQDIPGLIFLVSLPMLLLWRESDGIYIFSSNVRVIPVLASLIFAFLFQSVLNTPAHRYISRLTQLLLFGFIVSAIISTYTGINSLAGFTRIIEIISLTLLAITLYAYLIENPKFRKLILFVVTSVVWLCLVAYLGTWYQLDDPYYYNWSNGILPFFNHIRHLDYLLCLAIPIAYILWQTESKRQKVYSYIFLTFGLAFLIWTGGRGASIGVTVATVILLLYQPKSLVWIISSLILAIILSEQYPVAREHLNLFRSFRTDEGIISTDSANALTSGRLMIYTESLKVWWRESIWWGIGADGFKTILPGVIKQDIKHPHSVVVQVILQYGIIGSSLLGLLLLRYFRIFLQSSDRSKLINMLPMVSAFTNGLSDGNFYHSIPLFFIVTILSISLPFVEQHPTSNSRYRLPDIAITTLYITVWMVCVLAAALYYLQIHNVAWSLPGTDSTWCCPQLIYR